MIFYEIMLKSDDSILIGYILKKIISSGLRKHCCAFGTLILSLSRGFHKDLIRNMHKYSYASNKLELLQL